MLDLSLAINIGTRIGGFSPATLFAASEPGGWYDPSDLSTLYQDSAGTTPVTAPGQTVGMVLDKSRGLVLGPELATTFTTLRSSVSSASSYPTTVTNVGGIGPFGIQGTNLVAGKLYAITVAFSGNTSGFGIQLDCGSNSVVFSITGTSGTKTAYVSSGSGTVWYVYTNGSSGSFVLDNVTIRELPGNHLTQSTLSNRAIYGVEPVGGRRNLLTYTEQFDNAVWGKAGGAITADATTSPDGTADADKFVEDTSSGGHYVTAFASVTSGTAYTISVYVKASGRSWVRIAFGSGFASTNTWFDIANGTVGTVGATSATIQNAGNGWYRITATQSATSSTSGQFFITTETSGSGTSYTGDGTSGIFIWGAQLETGSTATAYQRVVTAFDVTEAGVPSLSYIQFDGSDDWLVSPTITPGIDKAQVFAGVRKLSDAAFSVIAEYTADAATISGSWTLIASASTSGAYLFGGRGSSQLERRSDVLTAPRTNVLTQLLDIGGSTADTEVSARINGASASLTAYTGTTLGTGNYANAALYIGRRGGASLPLNGRIYSLIVRFGANLSASTITQTENWVAGKTGITI